MEPASVTANAGQRHEAEEAREVNAAVRAWAAAWARKDMDAYVGAYIPGFSGTDASAAAWRAGRTARIAGKNRISVELSGLTVELTPYGARASFRQEYSGDSLNVSSGKTLELVKRNGKWLIRKETVGS